MKHALLVGGATGREHAIAKHFSKNGNYKFSAILWAEHKFIKELCSGEYAVINLDEVEKVFDKIVEISPDYVIIGQGEVIQRGLKDMLIKANIPCIAPTKEAAIIEGSKTYLRNLLQKIAPELNPKFRDFYKYSNEIDEFIDSFDNKVVVKCDGVISGPRVRLYDLPAERNDAIQNAKNWIDKHGHIVIEEYIQGYEVAIMSYTDGTYLVHTPPFKNHKRIGNGNVGENTSGMGTITCNFSFMTDVAIEKAHKITQMVLDECNKLSDDVFTGSLYGEFLVDGDNIKVIEYNCRFGNPSSLNILALMNIDFPELCEKILSKKVNEIQELCDTTKVSLSAYAVPKDYTINKNYVGGEINFDDVNKDLLYVGNIRYADGKYFLKNSRAFAICATAETLDEARKIVYGEMEKVKGDIYYRTDIGLWEV
ncbi:MAG: hypothetical protein IJX17_04430 [Clostridia bacterium]|nr:hypothetical protein [Clostridia bacterium]